MTKSKNSNAIVVASTMLLVLSLVWIANLKRASYSLDDQLTNEKLKSESLLSEKLFAEKELEKFRGQSLDLKDRNQDLEHQLRKKSEDLEKQSANLDRMKMEKSALAKLKKERADLIAMQSQLHNELQTLKSSYEELASNNKDLESTLALLQDRNRLLKEDLDRAMFTNIDQSLVHAVKGKNEKLTVKAKRATKLIANFEVPANYKNLSYKIIDSQGNVLSSKEGKLTSATVPSEKSYLASSGGVADTKKLQKIEVVYLPTKRLKTGVYRVEVSNENLYVGSLNMKLR